MQIIIGIDPDLEKSGTAIYRADGSLELRCLSFPEVLDLFDQYAHSIQKVVVEAGWLNRKSNFHGAANKTTAARIGKNVGENHAVGKLLECCAMAKGLSVQLIKPTASKKDAAAFKRITGYEGRTNQEVRDAAMLVFGMPFKT